MMKISTLNKNLADIDIPLAIISVLENPKEDPIVYDEQSNLWKAIQETVDLGDFKGKTGDLSVVYSKGQIGPKRILLVGLGKADKITLESIRKALGNASRKARTLDVKKVGICVNNFNRGDYTVTELSETLVQGIALGSYQDIEYRTKDLDKYKFIEELILFSPDYLDDEMKSGAKSGQTISEAVNLCRKLAWGPANFITPTRLAEEAKKLEEYGVKTTIIDRKEAEEIGLGSYLAVAKGTEEPPKFIIMDYGSEKQDVETVALIGKAITFDSGGISIKPGQNMEKMKADMTGGAVVIGAMNAVAKLGLDLHVVAIVPATDNMPSGKAYHPGDIIKSYSGQTIEVINTDAEGRMVLADALTYAAKQYKPKAMFDFATLTGAMMIALGEHAIGYFSNHDFVVEKLENASKTSGERIWRMPLWEVYDQQLKSDVADMKHTGGRPAGSITAARFLSKFTMEVPWAHLDIAGAMEQSSDKDYNPKGSKGPGVRLIIDLLRNWKA
ncbi:MAG: leucyl aminopeptidase [Candidatus Heimdallarchaeota archaeon]|nr:leucyl aminopeptidase [Candidatus Heimdallarchaeota archaeon]MCK4254374.1 leucyl aminopeptidase [Candidatus Heimdallarchaeota archaeon]